jgi:mono/diheme cytochrome c family protein
MRRTLLTYTTGAVVLAILIVVAASAFMRMRDRLDRVAHETEGAALFQEKGCIQCHDPDRTTQRIGPGLEGLLRREELPASGEPATRENVRKQLLDPHDRMPSYEDRLTENEMRLLLDYLETL